MLVGIMDEANIPRLAIGEFKFGGKLRFEDARRIFENLVYVGNRREFKYKFDAYHDSLSIVWEYKDGLDGFSSCISVNPLHSDPSRLSSKVHEMLLAGVDRKIIEATDGDLGDRVSSSPELSYQEARHLPLNYFGGSRIGNIRQKGVDTNIEYGCREIVLQEKDGFYEVAIAASRMRAVEKMAREFNVMFRERARLKPGKIDLTI